jgi:hypothetical protein
VNLPHDQALNRLAIARLNEERPNVGGNNWTDAWHLLQPFFVSFE